MDHGPIFIGGPDRCGKTLMQAFLVSHPNICIPAVGSNMWTYFYGQYGDLSRSDNFDRCLDAMLHYRHVSFLKPDPDRIYREFWQGEPTYARLFALFQQHYAERAGKPRWGDQTGLIERYADQIFAAYPAAKMIHMIRDPRDRYEASITLWPDGKGRVGGATARWLYSVGHAKRNLKRYPDRYKVVRYETLVSRTEETLREVCEFLGEAYTPAILTMEGAPSYRDKLGDGSNGKPEQSPVSTDFIGRFRQVMSKPEMAFMQVYASRDMVAYGYQLEPVQFSLSERLMSYFPNWSANLARMVSWRTLEAIQHNFPALLGRNPSSHMLK
jgi:Sulfotransferase family